ncbi:hypothetical protein COT44_00070 [Candidatus Shapirobacteria bacterium CG08_land_8_20_14_0_20_39_18]|uniref:Uncharacterized protein n=1 Tax=Candidatus Shapirobacteria bacterium CG08_land_8_20_14_0_20_39_18 TaxID=1974883 RepID=A0A2M6XEF7_9BACT|nr:MAG: hypothetical protein COT44_00070 [Candidatus Shapirobacteria bacterium CG08_land_8_20_14_0_20_39_18]PIY66097.1 MAG: hypothetical protein COY91_01340 [Candidatus Shapirobacteria bacterium CG_4_10_14_0_8_um_filter_39_15]PJE68652.1 MAG: hypothetical protein COU94_00895 [Candidatus Shapirobacteria bacterium CG10_big_fil_rev_8_21_14_0_10_38_8]
MSKRQKFILTSAILSLGMFFVQEIDINFRYLVIFILSGLGIGLTFWSLAEALSGISWLTTVILPTLFTAGVGYFYFLLPQNLLARIVISILYAVGIYALLLTENIFSVAAIRTIQLFRAAQAVGFILTLFTFFLITDTIFSLGLNFYDNFFLVFLFSFPLFIQGLWSINLENHLSKKIIVYGLFLALAVAQIAVVLSFWPLTITIRAVGVTTLAYVLLGLIQAEFQERLFKQTIWEYSGIGLIILVILIFTTSWGG